jgi:uncharacterized protein YbjQ (UPF0145 family)
MTKQASSTKSSSESATESGEASQALGKSGQLVLTSSAGAVTGFRHEMPMSTSEQLAGYRIIKVLGLVRGNSVRARHLGRDILATFRNIVGGEINDYTKLLAESREQSIDRMMDQARQMGANAVIGVRFTTAAVMQGAAEMLAYGTAVLVQVEDGPEQ